MNIKDDEKVIAKIGDVLECTYVESVYTGEFTKGKKYKVLDLIAEEQHFSRIEKCLAFKMIGDDSRDWNPPRRMFKRRNNFNCKHTCSSCNEKCGLWESE